MSHMSTYYVYICVFNCVPGLLAAFGPDFRPGLGVMDLQVHDQVHVPVVYDTTFLSIFYKY